MKKSVIVLLLILLGACVSSSEHRHGKIVRSGILEPGISKQAFLDVWGEPDRTKMISGDEEMTASWGGLRGGFFKGRRAFEEWDYERLGVKLLFDNDLVGWQTDKTVSQIKALAKPLPQRH